MSKKRLLTILVFIAILLWGTIMFVNNRPSKAISYNGKRYVNTNIIVPNEYLFAKIGSENKYIYWKITDRNETDYLAVKTDKYFYLYKTKASDEITFLS